MNDNPDRETFANHLRTALIALYDPRTLRESALVSILEVEAQPDVSGALRRKLCQAIESLRPESGAPTGSRIWRTYQVLRRRYTEQLTQQEVASDLGLSVRQLQREEKIARDMLADYLWRAYGLTHEMLLEAPVASQDPVEQEEAPVPTLDEELDRLQEIAPPVAVDLSQALHDVLSTLQPLIHANHTLIDYDPGEEVPLLLVGAPILRQAILNVLGVAVRAAQGGKVKIRAEAQSGQVSLCITAQPGPASQAFDVTSCADTLDMAHRLISLCAGDLDIDTTISEIVTDQGAQLQQQLTAHISLPMAEQHTVLVVDDNADVLHLYRRYLRSTHFRFVGTDSAQEGLELAQHVNPSVIVLDVMMPGHDGWTLLSQLREHPETDKIPVVVCTILAQDELALALGAAEFIRKPVSRADLVETLERLILSPSTVSD